MHIGGVEVVLLVPGRRGQDDVGEEPRGVHAEVDGDHQVKLSVRGSVAPDDLLRLGLAGDAEILAEHPVLSAEQVLEKVLMPLAAGAEQVGAPDEEVAREVLGVVRVRSEEHTSELQSLMRISYAVFCLKKKNTT